MVNTPIHPLLENRWSPRSFSNQPVETESLLSLFEAARWAPSANNLQPWVYIVTTQAEPQPYAALLGTLGERNQLWAKHAPVLILAVVQTEREPGKPHFWASYDLGQSVAQLAIEAVDLGLAVHQMAGFDRSKAGLLFQIPAGFEAMTVLAVGYIGSPDHLPEDQRQREISPRQRKPLSQFVFNGAWGVALAEEPS